MEPKEVISNNWWVIEIAIGLGLALILSFIFHRIVKKIRSKITKNTPFWSKRVHRIIHVPLQVAIWGVGIDYAVDVLANHFKLESLSQYTGEVMAAFIVACIGWILLRWVREVFRHLAEKAHLLGVAAGTLIAVSKLCSFIVIIIIGMIILQIFDIGIAPLIAFGGIGAAGVAFAAKDIIANFFGGIMLHVTRIFSIEDEVVIPSHSNFMGIVKEIGWYTTVIEDYFRRPVYFPNATFTSAYVINESRRTHRRIKESIILDYSALPNIEKIVEDFNREVGNHPDVDNSQSFSIQFASFGQNGLEVFIYILVNKVSYIKFLRVKQEVYLIMKRIVDEYGATFTYPTTNVNLAQVPPNS